MSIRFEKTGGTSIKPGRTVKVKKMKNIVEIVAIEKKNTGLDKIQKISKTEYVVKETGEIFEYRLSSNKSENIASLKKTFRRIRDLINNNLEGMANELHHTLTYAENMTDTKQLYKDFDAFWKRYRRKYGQDIDYIGIVEPQGRGAWHMHLLVRHNGKGKVFIPNDDVYALWGHGWTKTSSMEGNDNMGAYITAYLTDVELTEETIGYAAERGSEIKIVEVDGQEKKFIKGARVHLYPSGMNILRHSRRMKPPDVEEMAYKKAKKIVGTAIPNYSTTTTIFDDDKALNTITYEHYNLKRQ